MYRLLGKLLCVGALAQAIPSVALADAPLVRGSADAIRVEARESPVEEVMILLGSAVQLRYRTSVPLSEPITGTYQGALQQVLARILEHYDYAVKNTESGTEVIISRFRKGTVVVSGGSPSAEQSKPLLAQDNPQNPEAKPLKSPSAPWPSPPPPNQDSVIALLGNDARNQVPGYNSNSEGAPSPSAASKPESIATLTQSTTAALESLRASLSRLPF